MKKIERINEHYDYIMNCDVVSVKKSDLDELEQRRDEAVEALIDDAVELDKYRPRTMGPDGIKLWATLNERIMLIEKITGQTWEEIKAGKDE